MSSRRPPLSRLLALAALGAALAAPARLAADGETHAMDHSQHDLAKEHGGALMTMVRGERLEYARDDGEESLLWDLELWLGGDLNKLWIKTEGVYEPDAGEVADGEAQALWSHAVSRYFDLQAGVRFDFEPEPTRAHAVIGLQGLAPYWFEIDTALFVSDDGDVSARFEAEYDILLTQRLIAQPRFELELAAQEVPELGIGSGVPAVGAGLRLRYEIVRELAPYVGIAWEELTGDTADLARAAGEPTSSTSLLVGLRFWY